VGGRGGRIDKEAKMKNRMRYLLLALALAVPSLAWAAKTAWCPDPGCPCNVGK
jgi:hypothetical protein